MAGSVFTYLTWRCGASFQTTVCTSLNLEGGQEHGPTTIDAFPNLTSAALPWPGLQVHYQSWTSEPSCTWRPALFQHLEPRPEALEGWEKSFHFTFFSLNFCNLAAVSQYGNIVIYVPRIYQSRLILLVLFCYL